MGAWDALQGTSARRRFQGLGASDGNCRNCECSHGLQQASDFPKMTARQGLSTLPSGRKTAAREPGATTGTRIQL